MNPSNWNRLSGAAVAALLSLGCAPLSYPGARDFTDTEAAAFERCDHVRTDTAHVWRCGDGRLIDARREVDTRDSERLVAALGTDHPSLARPAFMKSDATHLNGERVRLTMLGYDDGLAIVITELGDGQGVAGGRAVTCALAGAPEALASEAPLWCKARVEAIWRTL
jgi:hypothetical protein